MQLKCSISKNDLISNSFVLMLIFLSGNPIFNYVGFEVFHAIFFVILFLYALMVGRLSRLNFFLNFFAFFTLVFLLQSIYFNAFTFWSYFGFFVRALVCLLVILSVDDFARRYLNLLVVITKLAILFWVVSFTGVFKYLTAFMEPLHQDEWTGDAAYSFIFHTLYVDDVGNTLRNSGFFWEPGAFAAYVILALVFLFLNRRSLEKTLYVKYSFVLYLGVLTSQSTMGYVAIFILFLIQSFDWIKTYSSGSSRVILRVAILSSAIVLLSVAIKADFLGEKIADHIGKAAETIEVEYGSNNTRFGSMLFDLYYIQKSPIFGNGLHESTRYSDHHIDTIATGHGNGLTDFIAKFGLLSFAYLCYAWFCLCNLHRESAFYGVALFLVICITLFSEPLFNYPLYWFVFFNARHSIARI